MFFPLLQFMHTFTDRACCLGKASFLASAGRRAAAGGSAPSATSGSWLRHTIDDDGAIRWGAAHGAVHTTGAERDHRTPIGSCDRFRKRAL